MWSHLRYTWNLFLICTFTKGVLGLVQVASSRLAFSRGNLAFSLYLCLQTLVVRSTELQVVILFAGVKGFIDRVDVNKVTAYEKAWLAHIKNAHKVSRSKSLYVVDFCWLFSRYMRTGGTSIKARCVCHPLMESWLQRDT